MENNNSNKGINADKVNPSLFSVDLGNAEYTIIIEVVNTLVGMSVIQNAHRYRKFNIMELKQEQKAQIK